jgi:hypothetical protein
LGNNILICRIASCEDNTNSLLVRKNEKYHHYNLGVACLRKKSTQRKVELKNGEAVFSFFFKEAILPP